MENSSGRQTPGDQELDRHADELEATLSEILETADSPAEEEVSPPATSPAAAADEFPEEELDGLIDAAQASGRRLARLGDCVLMVSDDHLKAFFQGRMPAGTTYAQVLGLLAEAGICFGIVPHRIYEVLPRRPGPRQAARRLTVSEPPQRVVVVAEGRVPSAPPPGRLECHFRPAAEEDVERFRQALQGATVDNINECPVSLTLVRPGQLLAETIQEAGEAGCDVFGKPLAPPLPPAARLRAGEQAALDESGRRCTATGFGYAVLEAGGRLSVWPPVWVSRDLLQAFLVLLPQEDGLPALSRVEIDHILQSQGIVHGILKDELEALSDRLRRRRLVERLVLAARGTAAIPGKDAEWKFVCAAETTRSFGEIRRLFSRSPDVHYLERGAAELVAKAVAAGERVAFKQPAVQGAMGRDVFGEEFLPDEPADAVLEVGEHLRFAENGAACFAEIFGYLGIARRGTRMELVSPVWVARDRLAAYFVHLRQAEERRAPGPEELEQLLALAGVRSGVDRTAIEALSEKLGQGLPVAPVVCLAQGRPPADGVDGRFVFAVDRERRPGVFRPDGSVDFKQLNLTPLLAAGQEIGTRMNAAPGVAGMDLTGRELPARDGREIVVECGGNVRLERVAGAPDRYLAEIEGELAAVERQVQGNPVVYLAVYRTLRVDGDVDFHTGHIDFPGHVQVEGAIRGGFAVKAEGNVVVGDSVEDGATVTAGGNVAVKHGIVGERTRVTAGGELFVRYISEARVHTRGTINVAEYILNASVHSPGEILVWGATGARTSGLIAGGLAVAGEKIRVRSAGTAASLPTRLAAGVDAGLLKQTAELQRQLDQDRGAIASTLRALEVERLEPAQIRHALLTLLLKARGPRRQVLARAVKNLLALQARVAEHEERKKQMDEALERLAMRAAIEVGGAVAARTSVRIGAHTQILSAAESQVSHVRFSLGKGKGGKVELQTTTL